MRIFGCWLIASLMLGPMSCGSSEHNASDTPGNSQAAKSTDQPASTEKPREIIADALVPALEIGTHDQMSGESHRGHLEFLPYDPFDFTSDDRASFHPHGNQVCASGCAASRHPTSVLTESQFETLLARFATEPISENSPALEKLLYYGRQTQQWIARRGTGPLEPKKSEFLRRELSRTHALISFRIVDEHGVVRTSLPPTRVPLDRRHVFKMEVKDLPPLITSGTVKRVGLHHLWTRL
ncbi:MAG: hypothetical protein Tsb009_39080 [Planctomycetaceae bacterium]